MHTELATIIQQNGWLDMDQTALDQMKRSFGLNESPTAGAGNLQIYLRSLFRRGGALYGVVRLPEDKRFFVVSRSSEPLQMSGQGEGAGDVWVFLSEMNTENAQALYQLFPFTRPVSLRDQRTTIGMGDRLGVATAGHIRVARQFQLSPVLAQQSVRENDFIGRTFRDVVANAAWLVFQEGFTGGYGADGDHLKTLEWIDTALAVGMPMITLDLTEVMRPEVADWSEDQVRREFPEQVDLELQERVGADYADKPIVLGDGVPDVTLSELEAMRCALMYGPALDFTKIVNDHLHENTGGKYDLEISIDETTTPTLPEHHMFIARELQIREVVVNSLAPRFIGDFQKAVDYIGDLDEFQRQFRVHCAIAREFGSYKISVHSGSDKFAVYPVVGAETDMRFHLKTSGTSWLEGLRTLAKETPETYRRIHAHAVAHYQDALKSYHITADFDAIPPLDTLSDADLPSILDDPNARQMLHISYGEVLRDTALRNELYAVLHKYDEAYAQGLVSHFQRHIEGLGVPTHRR